MSYWTAFRVNPNYVGYLYHKGVFHSKKSQGYYEFWDPQKQYQLVLLPMFTKQLYYANQEVLTKDNIALRFSFMVEYKIEEEERFLSFFDFRMADTYNINQLETRIYHQVQVYVRNTIAGMLSDELNEKRHELVNYKNDELNEKLKEYGVVLTSAMIKDITFPKSIQDLFAKHLEAKIRAQADLENARTVVAAARALKNASELMKDDENVRFVQWMELMSKIADKGKHTFVIGEQMPGGLSKK